MGASGAAWPPIWVESRGRLHPHASVPFLELRFGVAGKVTEGVQLGGGQWSCVAAHLGGAAWPQASICFGTFLGAALRRGRESGSRVGREGRVYAILVGIIVAHKLKNSV